MPDDRPMNRRHQLYVAGIGLFLLALITDMNFPSLANPRMGLSAHMVGLLGRVFNSGGCYWPEKDLPPSLDTAAFYLVIFGAYANLCTTFLAATFGMPKVVTSICPSRSTCRNSRAWSIVSQPLTPEFVQANLIARVIISARS